MSGRSRSSIYRMFNRGELNYTVGKDGKRRVETSELLRVFDDIQLGDESAVDASATASASQAVVVERSDASGESEAPEAGAPPRQSGENEYASLREVAELKQIIAELRDEMGDIREDNRRLLRLLEYQTFGNAAPGSLPGAGGEPATARAEAAAVDRVKESDQSDESVAAPPVTEIAQQGWRAYREMRSRQQMAVAEIRNDRRWRKLVTWMKNFFFGDWQKRKI